jgi:hypothetical protein
LKDYGSELVEVIDNGTGVEEENFQALSKWQFLKLKNMQGRSTRERWIFGSNSYLERAP